jgi:hypothetical protein
MGQRKGRRDGAQQGCSANQQRPHCPWKYTGCIIAAAFAPAVAMKLRSKAAFALFSLGALVAGIWPYLRNFVWTHNPVFPFLSPALSPALVTANAVKALASNTGAFSIHGPAQLFPFLIFAAMQKHSPGF